MVAAEPRAVRLRALVAGHHDLRVIETAGASAPPSTLLRTTAADVFVVDGDRGNEWVEAARSAVTSRSARVLLLTDNPPGEPLRATSFIEYAPSAARLAAAVRAVAQGLVVVPEWANRPSPAATRWDDSPPEPLTARELKVLGLLAEGLGNKEMAGVLGISANTVKFHVSTILAKLGAATRTEAVTAAIRRGMLMI